VRALYNILFVIFFVLSAPYYFMRMRRRGNWLPGFSERFGRYDPSVKQALTNRHVIWIHAVSVGEVNLCTQLIRALEPRVPNVKFVVSTTTTTGMAELRRRLPSHVSKIYYPVDRRKYVNRAIATINPEAVILVEAEIWPNFHLARAAARHSRCSWQRAAVRPLVSALQTIRLSVPSALRGVFRRRLPERGRCRAAARRRLPSGRGARRGQPEI
jgi:3-deoxy-D-manno-octulosonic-acid transferase